MLQLKINVKRLFTALWFWSWWTPPRCSSSSSWSSLSPVWLNFYFWYVYNNKCELVMYYGLSCFKQLYWTFFRSSMTFMYYISSGQKRKSFFYILFNNTHPYISSLYLCSNLFFLRTYSRFSFTFHVVHIRYPTGFRTFSFIHRIIDDRIEKYGSFNVFFISK